MVDKLLHVFTHKSNRPDLNPQLSILIAIVVFYINTSGKKHFASVNTKYKQVKVGHNAERPQINLICATQFKTF